MPGKTLFLYTNHWNCDGDTNILCKNLPQHLTAKKNMINSDILSSFAGWLCLKASHVGSVQQSGKAAVFEGAGCLISKPTSCGHWQESSSSLCGILHRAAHNMTFPRARWKLLAFLWPNIKKDTALLLPLFVISKLLSLPYCLVKCVTKTCLHSRREGHIRMCGHSFNTLALSFFNPSVDCLFTVWPFIPLCMRIYKT